MTSSDWNKEKNFDIVSYSGWHLPDRDFHYSWYEELITEKQFDMRIQRSAIRIDSRIVNPHGTK